MAKITSNQLQFLDTTDSRKLEVYITSNLPTTQIYDINNKIYSPNWIDSPLQLTAEVYLNSKKVTNDTKTFVRWLKKNGANAEQAASSGTSLTIKTNEIPNDSRIMTYICEATYITVDSEGTTILETLIARQQITFARVDTGENGTSVSIKSTTVTYGESASASTKPTSWQSSMPVVADGSYLWTRTVIDYTDDSVEDTVTYTYAKQGVKGDTGTSGSSITVSSIQYQEGTSATTAPTGNWSNNVVAVADGNYLWTKTTFSDGKIAYGVAKQGQKGDQGIQGPKGNDGQQYYTWVKYADTPTSGMSNDPDGKTYIGLAYNKTTATESTTYSDYAWSLIKGETGAVGPKGEDGKQYYTWIKYADNASGANMSDSPNGKLYIGLAYNKTTSTESSVASDYTWALFKGDKGETGDAGKGVKSVTEYYLATASNSGVTISTSGWTTTIQTIAVDKKYLWNYEVITYTDNTTSSTTPIIIGVYGDTGNTGATGKGIKSVTEYYLATTSSSGVTTSTTGWTTTIQALTATNKYLWNYELITYTDNSTATINPVIIGVYGDKGDKGNQGDKGADAYTVMLTNESHIFAGNISSAMAANATTQVLAYKGSATQSVTIVSVDGKTASTSSTATSIAGLSFSCSALSGTSPTITFTCTTSFVSPSGTIPIVLTVDGVTITKMFTYSIAFKGATGAQGSTGTSASLVDITPSALYFKSTTGKDGTFTPDYIYLYPRFQAVTYSKWEYSVNGGTTWVAASGANGLTISTYNSVANTLRIARSSTLYTDTVTSISFRCVSSNTSIYDTVSIAKIYDVVDLQIGGRNLLTNSGYMTNLNGWTVYSSTYPVNDLKLEANDIYGSVLTATGTATNSRIRVGQYIPYLQKVNRTLTFSMVYQAGTDSTSVTAGGKYSENDNSGEYGSFSGTNVKRTDLGNGFTYMETTFNLTYTEATRSFFVYIYPGVQTTKIVYCKLEEGNKATAGWTSAPEDSKTFQIYTPKGSLITNEVPEVTLQTFAYEGSKEITDATFKWYSWSGDAWIAISGATNSSLVVKKTDVMKTNVYKCEMTYLGIKYEATATVEDKTDIYESLIRVTTKQSSTNRMYWILYTTVYSEDGERDPLLGPISETAPVTPTTGAYWYKIDTTNYTVTLMKYSGTAWATTTDTQELLYDWFLFRDTTDMITLGAQSKVKIITASDFARVCNIQCNIFDSDYNLFSRSSQVLNDPSDPIVSTTEPLNPIDKQLWIKIADNGTYMISIWDEATRTWMVSEADSQNKVHVEKPIVYSAGDIWIVGGDYQPTIYISGVAQTTKHLVGTMLKAQFVSSTYSDSDWVEALNYKERIDDLTQQLNVYNQFFDFDETGLTMSAKNLSGQISEFKTKLTNTELGFYQGENKVAYINNNQLNISKAEIDQSLSIVGTSPMLSVGGFSFVVESNGSLSIVTNN